MVGALTDQGCQDQRGWPVTATLPSQSVCSGGETALAVRRHYPRMTSHRLASALRVRAMRSNQI